MAQQDEKTTQQEQEPFQVDEFRPQDAEGMVQLFHAVYGEGYPIRLFYDPHAIITANEAGNTTRLLPARPPGRSSALLISFVQHLFDPCMNGVQVWF